MTEEQGKSLIRSLGEIAFILVIIMTFSMFSCVTLVRIDRQIETNTQRTK